MTVSTVAQRFATHVAAVKKLMNFARDVLELAISSIRELVSSLENKSGKDHACRSAARTLQIIEGIGGNDSLRPFRARGRAT
jgi:hypothetical protein